MKYKFNSKLCHPPKPLPPLLQLYVCSFQLCKPVSLYTWHLFFLFLGTGEKGKPLKFHLSVTPLWGRFLPKSSFMRRRLPRLTYLQGDKGRKAQSRTGWVKSAKPSLKLIELDYRRGATLWLRARGWGLFFWERGKRVAGSMESTPL